MNSPQYFSCGAQTAVEVPFGTSPPASAVPRRTQLQGVLEVVVRVVEGERSAACVRSTSSSTSPTGASVHPHPVGKEGGRRRQEDADEGEEQHGR